MCALPIDGRFSIVADDLTGAMDVAAPFAANGLSTYVAIRNGVIPAGIRVASINLSTRRRDAGAVTSYVAKVTSGLGDLAMVKSDSAMRGYFGLEAKAAAEHSGGNPITCVLVCPAFPGNGRTVRDGILRVDGVPLDQTDVGKDLLTPITSPLVTEALRRNAGVDATHVALGERSSGRLLNSIATARGKVVFVSVDGETDADLDRIVTAAIEAPSRLLLCGSAGLASALARWLGQEADVVGWPTDNIGPTLLITASRREVTLRQVDALADERQITRFELVFNGDAEIDSEPVNRTLAAVRAGKDAILSVHLAGAAAADPARYSDDLLGTLGRAIETGAGQSVPGSLVTIGGDTSAAVLDASGAGGILLHSEPLPGVAVGHLTGGAWDGVRLATKSGAFGNDQTLLRLYDFLDQLRSR